MATKKIQNAINAFLKNLKGKITPSEIVMFGSRITSQAQSDSDIDLVVVSDDFYEMSEDHRLDILYHASKFIKPEIHPWATTKDELQQAEDQTLLATIRDNGVRISTRSK